MQRVLAWVGVGIGTAAGAGIAACVAVAMSMPQRAPTGGDYLTSLGLFAAAIAIVCALALGATCSIAALIWGIHAKRPIGLAVTGVVLNTAPVVLAFAWDIVYTRLT